MNSFHCLRRLMFFIIGLTLPIVRLVVLQSCCMKILNSIKSRKHDDFSSRVHSAQRLLRVIIIIIMIWHNCAMTSTKKSNVGNILLILILRASPKPCVRIFRIVRLCSDHFI